MMSSSCFVPCHLSSFSAFFSTVNQMETTAQRMSLVKARRSCHPGPSLTPQTE